MLLVVRLFNVSYSNLETDHKDWLRQCHNRRQQVSICRRHSFVSISSSMEVAHCDERALSVIRLSSLQFWMHKLQLLQMQLMARCLTEVVRVCFPKYGIKSLTLSSKPSDLVRTLKCC